MSHITFLIAHAHCILVTDRIKVAKVVKVIKVIKFIWPTASSSASSPLVHSGPCRLQFHTSSPLTIPRLNTYNNIIKGENGREERGREGKRGKGREGRKGVKWCTVTHYVQSYQKVPSSTYVHLVLCLERSRAFPFFINFTESPTISDSTDERALIADKPSAGIVESDIWINRIGHINRPSIQKIRLQIALLTPMPPYMQHNLSKPLFLKYELMSSSSNSGLCSQTVTKRTSLHNDWQFSEYHIILLWLWKGSRNNPT